MQTSTIETETETENKELEKRIRQRKRAIDELITTEKTYVNSLEHMFKIFVDPLKNSEFMTHEDHSIIFPSDLRTIYALHIQLSSALNESTKEYDPDTSKVGDVFIKYGELFKLYTVYFFKHEKAVQCLSRLKEKNETFVKWIQEQSHIKGNNLQLNIDSLLILPIQRLPRYVMIIKEIIKRTEKYHIDLYHLQEALDLIKEITELINDRMKENDRRMKVAKVEKRFIDLVDAIGNFVKPSRIFIAESSEIMKHDQYGNRVPITLFLFNDCLIYGCYEESYSYGYGFGEANLRFGSYLVFDSLFMVEDVAMDEANRDCNYNNIPSLKIRSRHHAIWISFHSHDECCSWFEMITKQHLIQKNLIKHKPLQKKDMNELCFARPVFVPDDYSDSCMDCKAKFSILSRRHHCYVCGKLCCNECTKYRCIDIWKLYFEQKEEYVRICEICHMEQNEQNDLNLIKASETLQPLDDDQSDSLDADHNICAMIPTTFDLTKQHQMSSTRQSKRRNKMKKYKQKSNELSEIK